MGSSNETSFFGPVTQPLGPQPRAGRLLRRLGGRGRRAARAGGHRHRHRRLDPPAGGALRRHRHQADLRPGVALRPDRLRLEPRPGRPARGAVGRGLRRCCCGAMAGFDPRDSTCVDAPVPDYARRARARRSTGLRIGVLQGVLRRRARRRAPARCVERRDRRSCAARRRCRRDQPARTCRCRCRPTTWSRRPSAPRTWRASTACASATAARAPRDLHGPLQALARRGLRRRGQAPHHDRHLRAVGRLLRRLLPQGAEGARA